MAASAGLRRGPDDLAHEDGGDAHATHISMTLRATGAASRRRTRVLDRFQGVLRRHWWGGPTLGAAAEVRHDRPPPAMDRRTVPLVALAMLLAAGGLVLFGQVHARDALKERFALRAQLGAGFVASYADNILAREQEIAPSTLGSETVTAAQFDHVVRTFGFDAALLLASDGTVLHVAPGNPELIGVNLAARYEHLADAAAGLPAVSNGVRSATTGYPIVAFAAPFDTAYGRRVLSGGYYLGGTPLSAYLRSAIPFSTASAYLIDENGMIVEANTGDTTLTGLAAADASLAEAVRRRAGGSYTSDGVEHSFATEPVDGTPLRLILAVPSSQLYAPLAGPAQWAPWVVLALLVAGTLYLLRVLAALAQSREALRLTGSELARSNRELQDFASIASHDLQEPLRKIRAFGDRLSNQEAGGLSEVGRDYLSRMTRAAERMQGLIDDLLAYSRVATRPHTVSDVSLHTVVKDVLVDLEQRLADTGGTVRVPAPLPTVRADPTQLRQLMQNLIGNALKYRKPEAAPEVRVSCVESTDHWRIEVADNGIGFEQAQADRIFAPFQRLHGRNEYEGTGMGLAICRRIAERHGGAITARSEPGHGATFVVSLPVEQPSGAVKSPSTERTT